MEFDLNRKNVFWAVVLKDKIVRLDTLHPYKVKSIYIFMKSWGDNAFTWSECKKAGWEARKVIVQPNKNNPLQPFIEIL